MSDDLRFHVCFYCHLFLTVVFFLLFLGRSSSLLSSLIYSARNMFGDASEYTDLMAKVNALKTSYARVDNELIHDTEAVLGLPSTKSEDKPDPRELEIDEEEAERQHQESERENRMSVGELQSEIKKYEADLVKAKQLQEIRSTLRAKERAELTVEVASLKTKQAKMLKEDLKALAEASQGVADEEALV